MKINFLSVFIHFIYNIFHFSLFLFLFFFVFFGFLLILLLSRDYFTSEKIDKIIYLTRNYNRELLYAYIIHNLS